jgi:hydroxypyruvate isomerase
MPKLAANLSFLFQEVPFLDRFRAAAAAGFHGVESTFPYEAPETAIAERLERYGLTMALLNVPPGDIAAGERGFAALPGREHAFLAGIERALGYAIATGCRRVHVLSGIWPQGATNAMGSRYSSRTSAARPISWRRMASSS